MPPREARRLARQAVALSAILVLYSNSANLPLLQGATWAQEVYNIASLLMLGGLLFWALAVDRQPPAALGLTVRGLGRSLGYGALGGLGMALPALAFFAFSVALPAPIQYPEIARLTPPQLLGRVLVQIPLVTALFEEVAFRGLLQAKFVAALGTGRGILATVAVFAAWHGVIVYHSIRQTNAVLPGLPLPLAYGVAYAVAMLAIAAGGLVFSLLRHFTRNLGGSVMAHWLVVALMVTALFFAG